jgi:hypothetical protein
MSDEQPNEIPEDEEIGHDELVRMLNNSDFLSENGYRLTPKGYMALILMEMGVPHDEAEVVAQKMSDKIFLAGYTYLHDDQLKLDFEVRDDEA